MALWQEICFFTLNIFFGSLSLTRHTLMVLVHNLYGCMTKHTLMVIVHNVYGCMTRHILMILVHNLYGCIWHTLMVLIHNSLCGCMTRQAQYNKMIDVWMMALLTTVESSDHAFITFCSTPIWNLQRAV